MFVLFDSETGKFLGPNGGFGRQLDTARAARCYKRRAAAVEAAALHNVSRNVPAGCTADHKRRNRPQVQVLELDLDFNTVAVLAAPPNYIYL